MDNSIERCTYCGRNLGDYEIYEICPCQINKKYEKMDANRRNRGGRLNMKKPKIKINNSIKLRTYNIISEAVNNGVNYGYKRAHKHTDTPDEDSIIGTVYHEVMNSLCEIIDFGD